ncbi:MAG: aspartyl-phosphate phosphatase Spo0E family protein [Clostridiales bacterium]|nr:aspartyl-phosphate phosphatase Spo0E family protein [Clostridiales bacterium]
MSYDIKSEIEKTRQALHDIIEIRYANGFDDEIVKLSQYMDTLLVKYMKDKGV